jgi:cytoskeletal protein CcmA (bactofilin family)
MRLLFLVFFLPLVATEIQGPVTVHMKIYDELIIHGDANLKLVKAKSLQVNGSLEFHNLDVSGDGVITGALKGDNGKFGNLKVTGPVTVSSMIVKDQAQIEGSLDAKHCKFKDLSFKGDHIALDEVLLENLKLSGTLELKTLVGGQEK